MIFQIQTIAGYALTAHVHMLCVVAAIAHHQIGRNICRKFACACARSAEYAVYVHAFVVETFLYGALARGIVPILAHKAIVG